MLPTATIEPPPAFYGSAWRHAARERLWLHAGLLLLTLFTTTLVGAGLAYAFQTNQPVDLEQEFAIIANLRAHPAVLLSGLPFSITLLIILLAHEMGHYVTCMRYRIDASLPYFLPAPTLIGTLGAFIRIRTPIYTLRALFDIGIAGPIAGFVLLVPALFLGVALSSVQPGIASHGDFIFGTPLLQRLFEMALFPGVPAANINLNPVARAAWVGALATALNLLPVGQLDGGHIMYSFFGNRHKLLSLVFIAALVPVGIFYSWTWLFWAGLLALFGLRHPVVAGGPELGPQRVRLGWFALAMFVLCFTLSPIRGA